MDVNQQPGTPGLGVGRVGGVPGWKKPRPFQLLSLEISSEHISIRAVQVERRHSFKEHIVKGCSSCAASATENLHFAWLGRLSWCHPVLNAHPVAAGSVHGVVCWKAFPWSGAKKGKIMQ